ncbi:MAG: geranylgeranyl reductase family protein [Candidatus Brocadiaceae bacterium]|jgi:geranylgeranyl reductase family protein
MRADVAVVGAGPAGCAAAHALAGRGLDVALLDRERFPRAKVCGDALSPTALHALRQMGFDGLERSYPIDGSVVLAPDGRSMRTHTDAPGAMLRREELDQRLLRHACAAGARFLPGARLVGYSVSASEGVVQLDDGRQVCARWVILATGADAAPLKAAGVLQGRAGPSAFGRRAYFRGVACPDRKIVHSFEPFLLPGYGWIFPLGDGTANVGVAVHCSSGPMRLRGKFERFVTDSMAAERFLRGAERVSPVRTAPLRLGLQGTRWTNGRLLVVGDALGAATPSNGEGIPQALVTGGLAAEAVLDGLSRGTPEREVRRRYAASVRATYGRKFRRARWARRLLGWAPFVNAFVRFAQRDERLADTLSWMLTGDVSPGLLPGLLRRAGHSPRT